MNVRLLKSGDQPALEEFLARHAATTMFLRSNLRRGGMVARPRDPHEGAYVGVYHDSALSGVVGHFWNGMLCVEGAAGLDSAARLATRTTGLEIHGMSGALDQVERLTKALGLGERPRAMEAAEYLYELDLRALLIPSTLKAANVVCRAPRESELDLLASWRGEYYYETIGDTWSDPRESVLRYIRSGDCRVLEVNGELVAYSHFNATVPDMVQVGGVWTPPEFRGRGYGRSVVAGHLLHARDVGVSRSILFTARENIPAQRAYEALGFQRIGNFGLLLFERT